jgi:hypothetical protein
MSETLHPAKPDGRRTGALTELAPEHTSGALSAEDHLDWDVWLPDPPRRPSGTVTARLVFVGRDRPLPVEFPDGSEDEEP